MLWDKDTCDGMQPKSAVDFSNNENTMRRAADWDSDTWDPKVLFELALFSMRVYMVRYSSNPASISTSARSVAILSATLKC